MFSSHISAIKVYSSCFPYGGESFYICCFECIASVVILDSSTYPTCLLRINVNGDVQFYLRRLVLLGLGIFRILYNIDHLINIVTY